jgi:hypothetical protein
MERILRRIDLNMFLGRVQDVRDPDLLQVREVLDRLAVRQADARNNLEKESKAIKMASK